MGGLWSQESPPLHLCGSCSLEGVCRDRWWLGPRTELDRCHQAGSVAALVCLEPPPQAPAVLGVSQTLPHGSGGPRRPLSLPSGHGVIPLRRRPWEPAC